MKIINIYKDIPTKLLTLTKPRNSPIQSQKAPKDFQIGQYQKYKIDQWLKKDYLNPIRTGGGHIVPPLSEIPIFAYFQIGNIGCYHLTFSFYQLSDKWKRN